MERLFVDARDCARARTPQRRTHSSPPRPSLARARSRADPLIWATGEGSQNSSVDQETIAYAALDITAKCVFGFILLFGHSAVEAEAAHKDTLLGVATAE